MWVGVIDQLFSVGFTHSFKPQPLASCSKNYEIGHKDQVPQITPWRLSNIKIFIGFDVQGQCLIAVCYFQGQFVSEYVGELIDDEEGKRRFKQAEEENTTNFYMLTLDTKR